MTFDEVISRFENPQRSGRGFKVRCPSHEDKKNSLSISEGEGGRILLKCQAGCATKTVIDAVNLAWRDLSGSNKNGARSKDDPVTARYVYVDEQQKPLFRVCRTRAKNFFQERFDPSTGNFLFGMNGTRRVLYHLPEIVAAETVYIVEGEKDADKLASFRLAATTSPGGASKSEDKPKWDSIYSECLKGKDVVILPDNDEPGQLHAIAAAKSALPVARSVKVVCLPDLPPKGDVSDYLSSHSKEELLALVEAAPPFTGTVDLKGQANLWPELLTAKDVLQAPKDPTRWVVEDCLPVGGASAGVAKPKPGKIFTFADMSISVSRGEAFLGRATQQGPVAYLFLDGSLPEIADVFVSLGIRESDPIYLHAGTAPGDCIDWLLYTIKQKGVKLVIIDTMQKLLRIKDLNDYAEVTNKIEPVLDAARQGNCHIMMLHHAKKESADDLDAAIGSTAIRGLCYTYLFLKRLPNSERRILRSDQRGGKNFAETAIGFNKTTGRLEIQGTMEDAEIEEAAPTILEFVEMEGGDVVEKAVRDALPLRTIIVSKALRQLFRDGKLERTGDGKKGRPFRYSLAADLTTVTHSHVTTSSLSIPYTEQKNAGTAGIGSKKSEKNLANADEILFPKNPEQNGNRMEQNPNRDKPGTESDPWDSMRENHVAK